MTGKCRVSISSLSTNGFLRIYYANSTIYFHIITSIKIPLKSTSTSFLLTLDPGIYWFFILILRFLFFYYYYVKAFMAVISGELDIFSLKTNFTFIPLSWE